MSPRARQLYLLLVLAADRRGSSFYGIKRCQQILGLSETELRQARMDLLHMDLLASDGQTHQLLSLPAARSTQTQPIPPTADPSSTAVVHTATRPPSVASERHMSIPEDAREILRGIFGRDEF
ncbi:MAG: hypothetical protein V3T15_05970 [Pseudomonadales bacterium]